MEENNNRQDSKDDSAKEPLSREPRTPPIKGSIDEPDSEAHQNERHNNTKGIEETLADRIKQAEIWMIVLTAIIAGATAANVVVFYLESESTSKQIGFLSSKAGEIVGSMNTALSDSREAINRAFSENQRAIEASTAQNEAALDASIESSRLDHRAWVTVESVALGETPTPKHPLKAVVAWKNSGKTPALNVVSGGIVFEMGRFPDPEPPSSTPAGQASSKGVIGPGEPARTFIESTEVVPDGNWVEVFNVGNGMIFARGFATYTDIYGREHRTNFCSYATSNDLRASGQLLQACPKGNTAN